MPIRIYEIAKELNLESREVLAKAKQLGISAAKVPSSSLDLITAAYLKKQFGALAQPAILQHHVAPERSVIVLPPPNIELNDAGGLAVRDEALVVSKPTFLHICRLNDLRLEPVAVLPVTPVLYVQEWSSWEEVFVVAQKESRTLEFKEAVFSSAAGGRKIAKSIAGMANRDGGLILIGVRDNGQIVGVASDLNETRTHRAEASYLERLESVVRDVLGPKSSLWVKITSDRIDQHTVVFISVAAARSPVWAKHSKEDRRVLYLRGDKTVREVPSDEAADFIEERFSRPNSP